MANWKKQTLRMDDDHGWRCKPGYSIFVADRGAVRFEVPSGWPVVIDDEGVKIHDQQPPDDNCRIQLSVHYLPAGIDWGELPPAKLLADVLDERATDRTEGDGLGRLRGSGGAIDRARAKIEREEEEREVLGRDPINHVLRPGLEIVWTEVRWVDPNERREARTRHLLGRAKNIQPFITMDFWPEDARRFTPVWKELVRSLRVGDYVADPRKGPQPRR